jgi:hypothetical protein
MSDVGFEKIVNRVEGGEVTLGILALGESKQL